MPGKKKVAGPEDVAPVTIGNIRFEVPHWGKTIGLGQNGGHIKAVEVGSEETLWIAQLYKIEYKENMEADKQDSFIISLEFDRQENRLIAINDRGRRFAVNIFSHEVAEL